MRKGYLRSIKMKKIILLLIIFLISFVSAGYSSTNFTLEGGFVESSYGSVNLTLGEESIVGPTVPQINFTFPTPDNETSTGNTSIEINVSIIESDLENMTWIWNETNYSMYNESLVLMMNFDNKSALGENETYVVDVSKNTNDGINNGSTWTSSGKYNGAFDFNGVNNTITSPHSQSLNFTNSNEFSFSVWVNTNTITAAGKFAGVISKGAYETSDEWEVILNLDNTGPSAIGAIGFGVNRAYVYSSPLVVGEWTHISGNFNGTRAKLFINNELVATTATTTYVPSTSPFYIGRMHPSGYHTAFWDGKIDEVRIWNRSLSVDEISQQYNSNLEKFNSTDWYFYSNQSNLSDAEYTYQACASNSYGEKCTEVRSLSIIDLQCSPTLDEDWEISDEQICDAVEVQTGTGIIKILSGGNLTLINGANVSAAGLELLTTGDQVFINIDSEVRL